MADEKKYNWFYTMPLIEKAGRRFVSSTRFKRRKTKRMLWAILSWVAIILMCINIWIVIIKWLEW
jgi:cytoskeletal protein RodZ